MLGKVLYIVGLLVLATSWIGFAVYYFLLRNKL